MLLGHVVQRTQEKLSNMQTGEKIIIGVVLGFVWFMGFMNPALLIIAIILTAIFVKQYMSGDRD